MVDDLESLIGRPGKRMVLGRDENIVEEQTEANDHVLDGGVLLASLHINDRGS